MKVVYIQCPELEEIPLKQIYYRIYERGQLRILKKKIEAYVNGMEVWFTDPLDRVVPSYIYTKIDGHIVSYKDYEKKEHQTSDYVEKLHKKIDSMENRTQALIETFLRENNSADIDVKVSYVREDNEPYVSLVYTLDTLVPELVLPRFEHNLYSKNKIIIRDRL